MRIEEMQYDFKLIYNRIDSNHKKTFSPAEIDRFLNRGKDEFTEIAYSGQNLKKYKLGFEVDQQRIDMLATLVVGQPEQPLLTPDQIDTTLNIYEFDFANLVEDYKHFLKASVKVKDCERLFNLALEQTDDINMVLKDSHRMPSRKWGRAVGQIKRSSDPNTETSLFIYTNGDFEIEGVYIEFLKKPKEVALGTYNELPTLDNPNPGLKVQVHCDLPEQYHSLIVDIAVEEAARVLEDVNRLKLRDDRITNIMH